MRAGSLDRRVDLVRKNESATDVAGNLTISWTHIATTWAEKGRALGGDQDMKKMVGIETWQGDQGVNRIDQQWRIRYREDIQNGDLVIWGGDAWEIMAIDEVGRREGLILMTRSRRDKGEVRDWT
jgi:head-tail adaptor